MNEELLMELSDCGSPEGLAQIIHKHIPLKEDGSANLLLIAKEVGVNEVKSTNTTAYEGILVTNTSKSKGAISYNNNSPITRKRFTIAHELGHFLLPFHDKNAQCASSDLKTVETKTSNQKKEVEANRFAIELLAPQEQIKNILKPHKEPSIEHILNLHRRFKISKEAAARRYIECTDHSVAIIFGKAKSVRYVLRCKDFPYISVNKEESVPEHIWQQVKDRESNDITDWYCVDPYYFLSEPEDMNGQELFCQTAIQKNIFHMSLLSLEDE